MGYAVRKQAQTASLTQLFERFFWNFLTIVTKNDNALKNENEKNWRLVDITICEDSSN